MKLIEFVRAAMWRRLFPAIVFAILAAPALGQTAPDALVKSVASEVMGLIRSDRDIQGGNQKKLYEVLETKLLPNFDFNRMTALAMGRNWNKATPEQQQALTKEFRTLLVRTYAGALANYKDNTVEYKPLRMQPADTDVVVKTQVLMPGAQPIAIDYSMEKVADGWKAYDVVVAGVSLVTNYRDEFNSLVRDSGVDGLIKALADKNRNNANKK
jgi:phospholipid transport system substrate-binding protein